jgi:protein-arginine kinase activator protein McsA
MLCTDCYQRGNHLTEPEISFHDAETLHWERMERELQRRIEEKVRIYNSKDMTQEELRALVPSLHEKAA